MEQSKFNPQIYILMLVTFAVGTETYVFSGLLVQLARDLNVSVATAGQLSSSFAIAYALSAPFMANFSARFERKKVLITALAGLALINLIAAAMPSFESLLVVRIIGGIIASLITPVAAASASALTDEKSRGKALAIVFSGLTLSLILGIPIGSLIGSVFNWRATFLFSGLLIILAAMGVGFILPNVPNTDQRGIKSLAIVKIKSVYINLLLTLIGFLATFTLTAYLSPVAKQVAGIEGSKVSLLQFAIGIGSIIGVIIGGKLTNHKYTPLMMKAGYSVLSITLFCASLLMFRTISLGNTGNGIFLGFIFWIGTIAQFALAPIVQDRLIEATPNNRNVVLALNGSMIFLGQGCGAAFGGIVISSSGLSYLGFAGAVIAVVAILITFIPIRGTVYKPVTV
ncbi:MFS transporter [Pedobacter sp. L105]|uniref:MFS transporter n=1 Tax=Pedobacter sp. L105 TaxID=1641871 RepID=UPI00131D5E72|nr:MFS transporter [Pedobacter sp. L105]